jgi:hypothetical protein
LLIVRVSIIDFFDIPCYIGVQMAIDRTQIIRKYKGLWVGLKSDRRTVVASGKTVRQVLRAAEKKGVTKPILFKVPTRVIPYIG